MLKLFLVVSFPIHLWTIFLFLRDFSWLADQRSSWDALGVGAYSMIIAFLDSLFVFIFCILLNFMLPNRWKEDRRLSMIILFYYVVVVWAVLVRILRYHIGQYPGVIERLFLDTAHPLRYIFFAIGIMAVFALLMIAGVISAHLNQSKLIARLHTFYDRIMVLAVFYLLLDVAGLVVLFVRIIG